MTSAALRLPAGGGVAGTVVITAAALPGAGRGQFTVSAAGAASPGSAVDVRVADVTLVSLFQLG